MSENVQDTPEAVETSFLRMLPVWGKRPLAALRWLAGNVWAIALRIDKDHVFMYAAGIAFNILTALVPTILLLLFILGNVVDATAVIKELNRVAITYIPSRVYREDFLQTIQAQIDIVIRNKGIAGLIGVLGLLWSASALAAAIRTAVNTVLRCREARSYFIYKLYDFLTIMLIGILVFASIVAGPLLQLVLSTSDRLGNILHLSQFEVIVSYGVNWVVTLCLFYVMFRYLPYQKQERHIVLIGTVTGAGLWELARYGFSLYISDFSNMGSVYGAYAFFAVGALWVYVSALVLMIGAEVAYHVKQSRWNATRLFNKAAAKKPESER